jgi:phage repressor protein C with HTH and peptisase S24 domain
MGDAMAREIEEKLGLTRGWMDNPPRSDQAHDGGHGAATEWPDGSDQPGLGTVRFPVLELAASAGPGREPADYAAVLGHIDLAEQWARKRLGDRLDRVRALPVKGDSMSPTINDGDLAFVDTGCNHFEGEGVYVLVFNQALLIKRLTADFTARRIKVVSDNKQHESQLASEDELTICGRVRMWMSVKGY